MKRWMFFVLFGVSLYCTAGGENRASVVQMNGVKLYYIPFNVESTLPVTENKIVTQAFYLITLPPQCDSITELKSYVGDLVPGRFVSDYVRLKITGLYEADIYIDCGGGVKIGNDPVGQVRDFDSLKELLDRLKKGLPRV